jgi:hypothetical protein
MIRREESGEIWVIHQAAHAYVAGQFASHWATAFEPRDELILAAYNHDAGWAIDEQTPHINAGGYPRTFTETDPIDHFTIWENNIFAGFVQNRYAGLLVSLHCTALYEQRLRHLGDSPKSQARIRSFLDQRHTWQDAQIAVLGGHPRYSLPVQPDRLSENLRLLQVWDYLSLMLCISQVHEQALDDIPFGGERITCSLSANGPRGMVIDPYPLDQPLTLWIDARQVIGAPFDSDQALAQALAGVPYKPLAFELSGP